MQGIHSTQAHIYQQLKNLKENHKVRAAGVVDLDLRTKNRNDEQTRIHGLPQFGSAKRGRECAGNLFHCRYRDTRRVMGSITAIINTIVLKGIYLYSYLRYLVHCIVFPYTETRCASDPKQQPPEHCDRPQSTEY